jgi:hypothetical protein
MADQEIDELKELVRQNIKLTQDTNRVVHRMQRASRLKSLFWFIVLCLSIGTSVYTYFYFFQPRIEQIKTIYQKDIAPLQSASGNFIDFIKNFGNASSTSQ